MTYVLWHDAERCEGRGVSGPCDTMTNAVPIGVFVSVFSFASVFVFVFASVLA